MPVTFTKTDDAARDLINLLAFLEPTLPAAELATVVATVKTWSYARSRAERTNLNSALTQALVRGHDYEPAHACEKAHFLAESVTVTLRVLTHAMAKRLTS